MIAPPSRVVHIQRFVHGRIKRAIVFLERPKNVRHRNLTSIVNRLGNPAKEFGKLTQSIKLNDWAFAHALLNLWTSGHGK